MFKPQYRNDALKKHGIFVPDGSANQIKIKCPKCKDKRKPEHKNDTPLSVNVEKGVWSCHNCGWSNPGNIENGHHTPSFIYMGLQPQMIEYFAGRGISEKTLERMQVTWDISAPPGNKIARGMCIVFPYQKGDKVVNLKFRLDMPDGNKEFWQSPSCESIVYGYNDIKGQETIHIVEGECFSPDTEILTEYGWKRIDEYDGSINMAQFNNDHSIDFVKPEFFIRKSFNGDLVKWSNEKRFEITTTPEHELVLISTYSGRINKIKADNNIPTYYNIPVCGNHEGAGLELSDDQIKFCIAVSADASIRQQSGKRYAVFGLKKERKIERLRKILNNLDLKKSDNKIKNGYQSICLYLPGWCPGRFFPHEWIYKLSQRQKRLILDEMVHWDGNSVPNREQTEYSSKYLQNATFIQTIAHLCGMKSTIMKRKNLIGEWFKVSILHNKKTVNMQAMKKSYKKYDGIVYCVKVNSGMIVIRQNMCISIVGNCDKLSMDEIGFTNTMSLPIGGINLEDKKIEGKLKCLKNIEADLERAKKIIMVTDNDETGIRTRAELERRIGPYKCYRVVYPQGCKDANDVLKMHGKEVLRKCIENAALVPVEGLIKIRTADIIDRIGTIYTQGFRQPEKVGVKAIDDKFKVRPGELTVITGVPSHGKSLFADFMAMKLAKQSGWHIGVFSPEHYPVDRYYARLIQMYVGKPLVPGHYNKMSNAEMMQAIDFIQDHYVLMGHAKPGMTIDNILELARVAVMREGIKMLVIDPWNRFEHNFNGSGEAHYVSQTLDKIDWFGRLHDVHVFLVAHPRLLQRNKSGAYNRPTLYDISGGANWRNFVYNGLIVWRDTESKVNITEIDVQKIKFEECGEMGSTIVVGYDHPSRSYFDLLPEVVASYLAKKNTKSGTKKYTRTNKTNGKIQSVGNNDSDEFVGREIDSNEKPFMTNGEPSDNPF